MGPTEAGQAAPLRIPLTAVAIAPLLLYIPVVLASYILSEPSEVDATSVAVAIATAFVLLAGIRLASRTFRVLYVMLAYYVACKYLLFPVALLYSNMNPDFEFTGTFTHLTIDTVRRMQVFGLLSAIVATSGLFLAERVPLRYVWSAKRQAAAVRRGLRRQRGFFVTALAFVALNVYIFGQVGFGSLSGVEVESGANLWNLANSQVPLYLSLAYLVYGYPRRNRWTRRLLFVTIGLIVLLGLLQGSRSSFFVTVLDLYLMYILVRADPRVRVVVTLKMGALCLLASFVAFTGATAAKSFYFAGFTPDDFTDLPVRVRAAVVDQVATDGLRVVALDAFESFLARVADSKAPYYIINNLWVHRPSDYLGPVDSARRTINSMVPGTPFEEDIGAPQLFDWVYSGNLVMYTGETWGLPTVCYLYFGYAGGLFAFWLIAFVVATVYRMLLPRLRAYAPIVVVLIVVGFNTIIQGGLVEIWLPSIYHFSVSMLIFAIVWSVVNKVLSMRLRRPRRHRQREAVLSSVL